MSYINGSSSWESCLLTTPAFAYTINYEHRKYLGMAHLEHRHGITTDTKKSFDARHGATVQNCMKDSKCNLQPFEGRPAQLRMSGF